MTLTVEVNDLPDNDGFLPRYLTVKLLNILAKALPAKTYSELKDDKFSNSFRHPELFTSLTYSIFWHTNPDKALADSELIESLDKYNRAPLSLALANEDFALALRLIEAGAMIYLEDKLILEIALMSILQRQEELAVVILSKAAPEDQLWLGEYLDYLHSYITDNVTAKHHRKRDVIDPPIRHFGQVLDTMVYFNGIPSYFGFLSPSLKILNEHLNTYTKDTDMAPIAKAFAFSYDTCKYHGNLPTVKNAAELLFAKIKSNFATNASVDPVVLCGGWAGNALAMAIINNTLIYSNLGPTSDIEHGTLIFKIKNANAITQEFVDQFIRGLGNATDPSVILSSIADIVDPTPIFKIKQNLNPIDNCIFVNPRIVIEGMMLVLNTYKSHGNVTADTLALSLSKISDQYRGFLESLYKITVKDLAIFIRNNQLSSTKRLECCSLALEYINQHFRDHDALAKCIELKNALEYVGLESIYLRRVNQEAQKAIQTQLVHTEETTAAQVIDQEYIILAKK